MSKAELEAKLAERLKDWRRLPNGDIAHLPYIESATFPMADGALVVALRFESRRTGQTDKTPEQLQLGLSPQQCRHLAQQLLDGAQYLESEAVVPDKPN